MSDVMRQRVEKTIVRRILLDARKAGYQWAVDNEEDGLTDKSDNVRQTLDQTMFQTDNDWLFFFDTTGKRVGWVRLIYGNSGWDVVCDYSANAATLALMKGANELADKYGG